EAYPNPADQSFNLMFPNVEEGELVEVMAFNANGQLLRQFSLTALKGQPQEIDVAGLPDGMYFILAESNGTPLIRQKVMISHK
ncbi:MAG: T9SS type A sorting domain-containing protein, partial [Phaeodactylibacter sp.]|nr:T9SS type A sorting domain-containing protein [Phaeodactylibacter sp.]